MSGFGTGNREGCHRNAEGRVPSELRLPCLYLPEQASQRDDSV